MTTSTPFTALASGARVEEQDKRRLIVLSRSLESRVHQAGAGSVVLVTFQDVRHMTPRSLGSYERLAQRGHQVAAYAVGAHSCGGALQHVAVAPHDPLVREWCVVVIGRYASYALAATEVDPAPGTPAPPDLDRRFRWTVSEDRAAVVHAAHLLLHRGPHQSWLFPAAAA